MFSFFFPAHFYQMHFILLYLFYKDVYCTDFNLCFPFPSPLPSSLFFFLPFYLSFLIASFPPFVFSFFLSFPSFLHPFYLSMHPSIHPTFSFYSSKIVVISRNCKHPSNKNCSPCVSILIAEFRNWHELAY